MLNLSNFFSLLLLFPKMGSLGPMWWHGSKGKAFLHEWSGSLQDDVSSPNRSLEHFAGTLSDPDHLLLVCFPTLQPPCASSGLCQFSGLLSTDISTQWGMRDLQKPVEVKVLPHPSGHLPRPYSITSQVDKEPSNNSFSSQIAKHWQGKTNELFFELS